jgi:hypothetical protein
MARALGAKGGSCKPRIALGHAASFLQDFDYYLAINRLD